MLEKFDLQPEKKEINRKKFPITKSDKTILALLFFAAISSTPFIYASIQALQGSLDAKTFIEHVATFVVRYNYFFAFYSITINSIYLLLLLFSAFNLIKQLRFWNIRNIEFLFYQDILPSISILSPAYNEGKTIVESVYSLLNLQYPEYEVVVINDGSKDNTLEALIEAFDLEKIDFTGKAPIVTQPVRAVYASARIPNL